MAVSRYLLPRMAGSGQALTEIVKPPMLAVGVRGPNSPTRSPAPHLRQPLLPNRRDLDVLPENGRRVGLRRAWPGAGRVRKTIRRQPPASIESAISLLRLPDAKLSAGDEAIQIALRLLGPLLLGLGLLAYGSCT